MWTDTTQVQMQPQNYCQYSNLKDKETISLNIFDDIIYKEQNASIDKQFAELTDDDIPEILLTVEATVVFNDNKNANTVIKLQTNYAS